MRLIDADALLERMMKDPLFPIVERYGVSGVINAEPTIDEVEVVRCMDCKWFGDFGCAVRIVDDSDKPTENDFCSFAERREDVT